MHSRRPPTLRHKGNRRQMTQHQQKDPQDEENRNEKTKNGAKHGVKIGAPPSARSRKPNGFPLRFLFLLVFLFGLGLYVKFMISNTTMSVGHNKVGNLRSKNGALSQEKEDNAVSNDVDGKLGKIAKADAKDEKDEEQAWKSVVEEQ